MRSVARTLAATAAAALAVSVGSAHAQVLVPVLPKGAALPPPASSAAFCQNVPATYEPFTDIDASPYKAAIECLAFVGVTLGGPGGDPSDLFGPDLQVSRDAMASFVMRTLDVAKELESSMGRLQGTPAYDGTPAFPDIVGNTHEGSISRIARFVGVSGVVADERYDPATAITRAQMASFLSHAVEVPIGQPVDASDDFYDDDGSTHEYQINAVTTIGLAQGTGPRTYRPGSPVTRDNMAEFLVRYLSYRESSGLITPAVEGLRQP